jgi:3-methyladenine DNA glycosylase AlkD
MTCEEVMKQLEAFGSEQTRKTYKRHGVGGNVFGVSYADLGNLKKKIKIDHELANGLWATGNHDARILAAMIADPARATEDMVDAWVQDLTNHSLADEFANYVSKTAFARRKADAWSRSENEWIGRAGWALVGRLALMDTNELPDDYFTDYLETIQRDIHTRKNRIKQAMNSTVIAIGVRNAILEQKALAAAGRIGKVLIDHGDTDCKTPDAAEYIRKTLQRKQRREAATEKAD